MLVLTRKRTEKILIGEDIVITVIHTSAGSVKIGIQAPSDVRVLRAELNERPAPAQNGVTNPQPATQDHGPVFSADQFLHQFNADYVSELEDQTLMCLAK